MSFTNVRLILVREIRDQFRDRRTLFMIFVLPVLLYPLLGMTMSQMVQFRREHPARVLVVGGDDLGGPPPLFEGVRFAGTLFANAEKEANLLELTLAADLPRSGKEAIGTYEEAFVAVQSGQFDAALYFPPDFAQRLKEFRKVVREPAKSQSEGRAADGGESASRVPSPCIISDKARELSRTADDRLSRVLSRWTEEVGRTNLAAGGMHLSAARPFDFSTADVAEQTNRRGADLWSKLLPVLLLIWALTGAFYPAVDVCAGEKERGTLETLLSSPAERSEIALGKLLTIMTFSMITSVLNLVSVGVTGWLIFKHFTTFSAPPPLAVLWLGLALVPVAALFSALCLALAAFARSTKEGQYYLMPLLLVTLPLAILPMMPGVELGLGTSLVPVTGIVLLLRNLLEGNYWPSLPFVPVVAGVTLAGCWVAVRWAVDQFNSESVLFRESERFSMGLWARHLVRDRQPTPTAAAAVFCGVLILLIRFVMQHAFAGAPGDFAVFARTTLVLQFAGIAAPALLMTTMLTSSPRQTLLLRIPAWQTIPAAVVLAVVFHPVVMALREGVCWLYPFPMEIGEDLGTMAILLGADPWLLILLLAVTPAVCEELAFRGFILSGLRSACRKWPAILASAVLFGVAHAILQQWIITFVIGLVIACLAVQTRSILPGMIFHVLHNTLGIASTWVTADVLERWPVLRAVMSPADSGQFPYSWPVVALGGLLTAVLLAWFTWLPEGKTPEMELQEAFEREMSARARRPDSGIVES